MENKSKTDLKAQGAAAVNGTNGTAERKLGVNLPAVQKKAIDLATVIKTVDELHKKVKQRDKLEYYSDELRSFSVQPSEEELEGVNRFMGCSIKITDDNSRQFELRNPIVIKDVIEFMFGRFEARKAEIEAELIFPNAA